MSYKESDKVLINIWSFLMPLILATWGSIWLSKKLFADKEVSMAIQRAGEVILSESELQKNRENPAVRTTMTLLNKVSVVVDLNTLILNNMRNMYNLMGQKKRAERELALFIVYGFAGALPLFLVPLITDFWGYVIIYPIAAGILTYQQYLNLQKEYRKWQREIIKDLPELIDKLRISFASGRDYISTFAQARENSGPKMRAIIDKLINDLQCMRPSQALDLFADSFRMPVVNKFASAVKIAIEYGYAQAENYFKIIENDIIEVRKAAIEELTRSKPEKVKELYIIIITLAVGTLLLKGWEIFTQFNEII